MHAITSALYHIATGPVYRHGQTPPSSMYTMSLFLSQDISEGQMKFTWAELEVWDASLRRLRPRLDKARRNSGLVPPDVLLLCGRIFSEGS